MHEIGEVLDAFEEHRRGLGPTWLDDESGPALLLAMFGVDE